jgi:uncharacterized protein YjeT (DUF2065 family)
MLVLLEGILVNVFASTWRRSHAPVTDEPQRFAQRDRLVGHGAMTGWYGSLEFGVAWIGLWLA